MPMRIWPPVQRAAVVAAAFSAVVGAAGAQRSTPRGASLAITALAPVDVLASEFRQPSAVAVEPGGAVLVADRAAGTLTRVRADGGREVLLRDLRRPTGIAVDGAGHILVLEAAARRIVRLDPTGTVSVVASTLRRPRAIAAGPDGRLWVAVRREPESHDERGDRKASDERGTDVIVRLDHDGTLTPVATGLVGVEGLAAAADAVYVTMARAAGERGPVPTRVARIPLRQDGTAEAAEPLLRGLRHRPWGIAVDVLGGVFIGTTLLGIRDRDEDHDRDEDDDDGDGRDGDHKVRGGIVLKWHDGGVVSAFAREMGHPLALAFAPGGDLVALELRQRGRLLRFRVTPPPVPRAPLFTNRAPLTLSGRAQPGDRVHLFRLPDRDLVGTVVADPRGEFTVEAALAANARNDLLFRATAAGGRGLSSPGVEAVIVHDDVLPRVSTLEPAPGTHVRGPIVVRGRGEDEGSGVAAVRFLLDDQAVASIGNPAPAEPLVASAVLETAGVVEGPHALTTVAEDRAGNSRAEAQLLVVDRTPPETVIVSGPAGETAERGVRFTVGGADVLSALLDFSWRLDEGAWSPFGPSAVVELTELTPGAHRFEVRARDQAGNDDPTPAVQTFTVRSLRISILEPPDGGTVSGGSVWVRGTAEGGTGEVSVRVALPADVGGDVSAPVEGGMFALEVPAVPALTELTVVAADESGATARASLQIAFAPDGTLEESLDAWPPGGVAPLDVRIGLDALAGASLTIDFEGDGTVDVEGVSDVESVYATYARPGVYLPTVRMTTASGAVITQRGLVEVYDGPRLDARLQAVWRGFKDALRQRNVQSAVGFVAAKRRVAWVDVLASLPPDAFEDVDLVFTDVRLVEIGYGAAQYEMVAERDGLLYSYPIWFRIDADGRWRLWRF